MFRLEMAVILASTLALVAFSAVVLFWPEWSRDLINYFGTTP